MRRLYLSNTRLLVVDDNGFTRQIMRSVLRTLGCHDIVEASDGAEGLKVLETLHPDIIIVDWVMSPVNGIEFVREVRGSGERPHSFIPIIMLTGYSDQERVLAARDAGVDEVLVKPFSANALFTRIRQVTENRRPFIRCETYFGPDRRRRDLPFNGPDRRRRTAVSKLDRVNGTAETEPSPLSATAMESESHVE